MRSAIRWDEVHERLRSGGATSDIAAVFRRRALELAREAPVFPASAGFPSLVFTVAGESYALALGQLAEVAPFRGCTQVPGSPAEVLGVLNRRGDICPVIDLGRVLAGRSAANTGAGFVLVLRARSPAGTPAVLKIDEARGLREIRAEDLVAPATGQFVRPFISPAGALALLDAEAMLPALFARKESRIV